MTVEVIFKFIELVLSLIGLWDSFLIYTDKVRAAQAAKRNQDRDKALDDAAKAETPEDAYDAEGRIVDNLPH